MSVAGWFVNIVALFFLVCFFLCDKTNNYKNDHKIIVPIVVDFIWQIPFCQFTFINKKSSRFGVELKKKRARKKNLQFKCLLFQLCNIWLLPHICVLKPRVLIFQTFTKKFMIISNNHCNCIYWCFESKRKKNLLLSKHDMIINIFNWRFGMCKFSNWMNKDNSISYNHHNLMNYHSKTCFSFFFNSSYFPLEEITYFLLIITHLRQF